MGRLSFSALGGALVLLVAATPARAAGNSDAAAAEALFVEAKKLAAQKKYAAACPKFAESNRLDRAAGTMIHLGDCYEKTKQTASAWAVFKEATSAAQALGRKDWARLAAQRARALEPKLAHLTIKVDSGNDKIEVTRDGTSVSQASFNVPIPIDIGPHAVQATATGFKPWSTTATVSKDGESIEVAIPKLEADPTATPAPTATATATPTKSTTAPPSVTTSSSDEHSSGSGQRTVGILVGAVGVAGIATGAVTGLMAIGKKNDAKHVCAADGPCASRAAVDASESAKTFGLISTIGFIAGGVGLAAGAALIFTATDGADADTKTGIAPRRVRVAPNVSPDQAGLSVAGVF